MAVSLSIFETFMKRQPLKNDFILSTESVEAKAALACDLFMEKECRYYFNSVWCDLWDQTVTTLFTFVIACVLLVCICWEVGEGSVISPCIECCDHQNMEKIG